MGVTEQSLPLLSPGQGMRLQCGDLQRHQRRAHTVSHSLGGLINQIPGALGLATVSPAPPGLVEKLY